MILSCSGMGSYGPLGHQDTVKDLGTISGVFYKNAAK